MRRAGLALIVVSGVLGLFAVLAAAFVSMARLERQAAQQRAHAARAFLLARGGIEDALARLGAGQDPALERNRYGGEDWDGDGAAVPDPGVERDAQVFRPAVCNRDDCPAAFALRPSWAARSGGLPVLRAVDGRARGFTGSLAGDQAGGNLHVLKVQDESAKVNVNGGFLDGLDRDADGVPDFRDPTVTSGTWLMPGTLGWNDQLLRVLNALGSQPELGIPTLGTDVVTRRPRGGYRSLEELADRIGATTDLSSTLTVSSWVDAKVVHPNGRVNQPMAEGLVSVIENRLPLRLEPGGRPPVNLNAASRPVLVALIAGLQGVCVQNPMSPAVYRIDPATALSVADRLVAERPFGSWQGFSAFCDGLVPTVISGMNTGTGEGGNLCGADLLKANFDPNAQLNKTLPDQLMWRWMDKSDLTAWSTEGSLGPTGVYTVSSVGRVVGARGRLLAQRELSAAVQTFQPFRQTTQRDFVGGRILLDPAYLSRATSPLVATTGASAPASWWGGPPPLAGLAVATYPCPPTALPANAAEFDGCIGLATVETRPLDPTAGSLLFLQHFDDALDADRGNPAAWVPNAPPDLQLQTDLSKSVWPDYPDQANSLRVDGFYAQRLRCPAYQAPGNIPSGTTGLGRTSNRGVVQYWVKPVFPFDDMHDVSCVRQAGGGTHAFACGRNGVWGAVVENSVFLGGDNAHERSSSCSFPDPAPGARWWQVTALFDTDETAVGNDLFVWVRGARGSFVPSQAYPALDVSAVEDLTGDDALLVMGASIGGESPGRANQVIDEFSLADFGTTAVSAISAASQWSLERYREGRYYKENDGTYTSPPLALPGGRLLSARWTEYLPRENRQEIAQAYPAPPVGAPRPLDATLQGARLEVELLDGAGTLLQPLVQGAAVQRLLPRFRYRVRFLPTPSWTAADRLNLPVLETPFLDDITFDCQPANGPRFLRWGGA